MNLKFLKSLNNSKNKQKKATNVTVVKFVVDAFFF